MRQNAHFHDLLPESCFVVFLFHKTPLYLIKALCKSVKLVINLVQYTKRVAHIRILIPVTFGLFGGSFKLFL